MALNRARVSDDIGVTVDMQYVISVEFFDAAAPAVVLWAEQFKMPVGTTQAQLQARMVTRGQEIRASFAARDAARVAVPVGTTITVP